MKKPTENLTLPDRFVLDKKDVTEIIDSVQDHWKRDGWSMLKNAAYAANMELVKAAVTLNSTNVLGELYFSIVEAVHQIETLNSLKLSVEDSEDEPQRKSFQTLFDIQKHKIKSGDAFIEN